MPKKIVEKKPKKETKSKKITQAEFEKKVLDLAKQGLTAEKIGETLRKQGIHPQEYTKKISKILKEANIYTEPNLKNIETRLARIQKHYSKHSQDKRAMREKDRVFAQLRKVKKHTNIPLK
jgi:ribosomal protein S15P/S13E